MIRRNDLSRELVLQRRRTSSAIKQLNTLRHGIEAARETIERSEQAYHESINLLERVEKRRLAWQASRRRP